MILYRQGIMAALRYDSYVLQMYYSPIPQEVEQRLQWPLRPFDLDTVVPHPVAWPNEPWVDLVDMAKDEFEVDDASAVFSMWRVQEVWMDREGNIRPILDARMTDE